MSNFGIAIAKLVIFLYDTVAVVGKVTVYEFFLTEKF